MNRRFLKRKHFYLVAVLLLMITGLTGSTGENRSTTTAGGNVVFSEVLYDSSVSYDTQGEWIELYNPQSTTVDIGRWTIQDNTSTFKIPGGTTIGPQTYLIIADGINYFSIHHGCTPGVSYDSLKLSNTGDYLILRNSNGTIIDQVAWESGGSSIPGWGSSSQPKADEGRTIRRSYPDTDTNTYSDWISNSQPQPNCGGGGGNPQAQIELSESQLSFNAISGETTAAQTFRITNSGSGTLNWSITTNASWLDCSPLYGIDSATISVSVVSSGLSSGTYTGTISVSDPDAVNSPQTIAVTLSLSECSPPSIQLSASRLFFEGQNGNTAANQTFNISNSGCQTLNWTVSTDSSWLSCSPVKGENSGKITVSVDSSGLADGTYTGTITVTGAGASNSPQTIAVTLTVGNCSPPIMQVSRTQLYFGSARGVSTAVQDIDINNAGCQTMSWSAVANTPWLKCTPASGTESGKIDVSVETSGLQPGNYPGTVFIQSTNAVNSPQIIAVILNVYSTDSQPFGTFATPIDGSTVSGSISVTGWALDDVGVESVKIYRKDGGNSVYIGDAVLVEGARPDVEIAYPGYPNNHKAGWGYMLLTNFLPNKGNGTFVLEAKVNDTSGNETTLGGKTIYCDNANAVKPFGAIDTPTQGGSASGNPCTNWGWVLTPLPNSIPPDGSTIDVYVDGVYKGHTDYNIYREDIASLFPGYANGDGAAARFQLDTTGYANGIHTIHWTAQDSAGNTEGIGSRYFSIQNAPGNRSSSRETHPLPNSTAIEICSLEPVQIRRGYNRKSGLQWLGHDEDGVISLCIGELEPLEIHLGKPFTGSHGYVKQGDRLRPLPVGSTFDRENAVFYWQPGPGFVGTYELVFIKNHPHQRIKKSIKITIPAAQGLLL